MSELKDTREEYADALLRVREAAQARGFEFVEVMLAMARMAECMLERLVCERWAEGGAQREERFDLAGWWEKQEHRMKAAQMTADRMRAEINAQRNGVGGGPSPVAPGGRPHLPGDRGEGNVVVLPAGIEMGEGPPPASVLTPGGKVNPFTALLLSLKVGGWLKVDTRVHKKRSIGQALAVLKKTAPTIELERRYELGGHGVVIVRKK